ncbi:MAG TPA: DksA/TraR family C4-type zinc finger protein [Gammaproteobacteria bacterium]|nr:DksA/TraR family C4-type zinc finger protein [Gammaproteobacteria bacterium]
MASGWAKDGAVQDQIDSTVEDALLRVRGQLPQGESLRNCEECDTEIPAARREAIKGVRLCIACQNQQESRRVVHSLYNRRGSKDSQLR